MLALREQRKVIQLRRTTTLSLCLLTGYALLYPKGRHGPTCLCVFFAQQKVGQKIAVTGGFKRYPARWKKQYFMRDSVTGDVEYMGYFGMTMVPTLVVGNGSVSIKASLMDKMLLLYLDQGQVKDLPLKSDPFWCTGTLISYQYGTKGITRGMGVAGIPIFYCEVSQYSP